MAAHLKVAIAAMAVGHLLEQKSGLSLNRLVRTLRKYRRIEITVAVQVVHAALPLPRDVAALIERIGGRGYALG